MSHAMALYRQFFPVSIVVMFFLAWYFACSARLLDALVLLLYESWHGVVPRVALVSV